MQPFTSSWPFMGIGTAAANWDHLALLSKYQNDENTVASNSVVSDVMNS